MSNDPIDDVTETESTDANTDVDPASHGSSNWKVLGAIDAPDGSGVLGHNTATSGKAVGINGVTDSPSGYGLYTPNDARIEGTMRIDVDGKIMGRLGIGTTSPSTALDVEGTITADATLTSAVSTEYVTAGSSEQNGNVVIGENTASSGTPIGVEGATPNTNEGYGLSTPDDARVGGSLTDASGNAHLTLNDGGPLAAGRSLDMNGNDILVEGSTQISGDSDVTVRIDNTDSATGGDEFRVLGNTGNRKFDVDNTGNAKVHNNLTVSNAFDVNGITNFQSHVYTNGNKLDLGGGRFIGIRNGSNVLNDLWGDELGIDTDNNELVFYEGSPGMNYRWNADTVSSVRYKENIEPWSADPYGALELEAKEFDLLEGPYGGDGPTQIGEYGFLAEDADESAPWVVQYVEITEDNKDGFRADDEHVGEHVPDRIDYDKFTIAHNEILADHDEELDDLEADLDHGQSRIDEVEAELKRKDDRISDLEADNQELRAVLAHKDDRIDALEDRLSALEAQVSAASTPADD